MSPPISERHDVEDDMDEGARDIFDRLRAHPHAPLLRGVSGTYRFDVEGVGSWRVTVDDGALWIREGTGEADCSIGCPEHDFVRLMHGETNLVTALMRGELRVEGDRKLVKAFHGMLPAPPSMPRKEEAA
ncbi:MAG: SCP2 sterol-binding domain-containing protein [Planctomycetota bacterium]